MTSRLKTRKDEAKPNLIFSLNYLEGGNPLGNNFEF
jgi:hypothetical protein